MSMSRERLRALADPSSAYFQQIGGMLRQQMVENERAEAKRDRVVLPVVVTAEERAELSRRFRWKIDVVDYGMRARSTPYVSALIFLMGLRNHMLMGSDGEEAIYVDADLAAMVAKGMSYGHVCRTHATPRLQASYMYADAQVKKLVGSPKTSIAEAARAVLLSQEQGSSDRVCSNAAECTRQADTVFVNHAETPMSLAQAVSTAKAHGAVTVRGVCFFQPEMLSEEEGEMQAFPGRFVVDRSSDMISFLPRGGEDLGFSHPYSSLVSLFVNHEYVRGTERWLVEKHLSQDGVYHYVAKKEGHDAGIPEVLSVNYYKHDFVKWIEFSYASYLDEETGRLLHTPRRVKTRLLESVYEKVMPVLLVVPERDLTHEKVLTLLKTHNNMVVCHGDTVVKPIRVWYNMLQRAVVPVLALAVAKRMSASKDLAAAIGCVKQRFRVRGSVAALLWAAGVACVESLQGIALGVFTSRDVDSLADIMLNGIDVSVTQEFSEEFVNVTHLSGSSSEFGYGRMEPWLPAPKSRNVSLLARASMWVTTAAVSVASSSRSNGVASKVTLLDSDGIGSHGIQEPVMVETTEVEDAGRGVAIVDGRRKALYDSLVARQDASAIKVPTRYIEKYVGKARTDVQITKPLDIDPVAVAQQEYDIIYPGVSLSDEEVKPYVAAASDLEKNTWFVGKINDSKRVKPPARVIRRSRLRTGGAGRLPGSQSALLSALWKRNTTIPPNRGFVKLDEVAGKMVDKMIEVSYVDGWENKLASEFQAGLWTPVASDVAEYVPKVPSHQVEQMMKEFVSCSDEQLTSWLTMVKATAKPPVDRDAAGKVQLPQTIMYSEHKSVNAKYSAIQTRLYRAVKSLLRPNISFNSRDSPAEHEIWFNSCAGIRSSAREVFGLEGDITCFDRSQEHAMQVLEFVWYRRHGINNELIALWTETHGVKKAMSMMYGLVMFLYSQGLSGIWKTLFRNGLLCWGAVLYCADIQRDDVITLDVVGDDFLAELTRNVNMIMMVDKFALTCNFTAKLYRAQILGICSKVWVCVDGWYYYVQNPMRKIESISNAVVVGSGADVMEERWESLRDDLRHYDNALVMEATAEAVKIRDGLKIEPSGIIRALATMAGDKQRFFGTFGPEEVVTA